MLSAMQRQSRARARSIAVASLASALLWLGLTAAALASPRMVLVEGAELGQLHEALRVSLAPWAFEIVDWPRPAPDAAGGLDAAELARTANARYVVWYDGGEQQLVVFDAELDRDERRPLEELPREEADATALSLSIKTMLRLQPISAAPERPAEEAWALLPELHLGPRLALDGDAGAELRAHVSLMVRPPGLAGLRLGVRGDVGTSDDVENGPFKGQWSEWSAQFAVGKDVQLAPQWQLGGELALGLSRATLSGEEMKTAREESNSQLLGAATVQAQRLLGPLAIGVAVEVAARGTHDHVRSGGQALWEEPSLLLGLLGSVRLSL